MPSPISPSLRELWEELPPAVRQRIRAAGVTIRTADELKTCAALIEKQESDRQKNDSHDFLTTS